MENPASVTSVSFVNGTKAASTTVKDTGRVGSGQLVRVGSQLGMARTP